MVRIKGKRIGNGEPCFIVFEAGATHNGVDSAKRLVDCAAEAGADAIKFQISDPDRLIADRKVLFEYEHLIDRETEKTERVVEPLYDILVRRYLSNDEWREVKAHCDESGIAFFATAVFKEGVDLLAEIGCDSIKIASADVNHFPLIRYAAGKGIPLQLDTGNASIGQIERSVDVILSEGNDQIIIHHCPSGSPAHLESINLNIVKTLKQMFPFPIAFSDHTPGWDIDVAALALGVNLLEKTITEDRTTRSAEHLMSLEGKELKNFIKTIRNVETAMGISRRILDPKAREKQRMLTRSIILKERALRGQKLCDVAVEFRSPGIGITPDQYEQLLNHCIRCDLPAGHLLNLGDLGQAMPEDE